MQFGSVCSGIEAASVAWEHLGWRAAWFSEIEPFPSAVLAHHYPDTPNLGDMTAIAAKVLSGQVIAPDVLCGGTPCQAFSVAGMRKSLDDKRGGLTLKFVELANAIDHVRGRAGKPDSIIFWENVPGVLSTKDNAFGCFLGALVGESDALQPAGGKWTDAGCVYGPQRSAAWRVLDAQYFGLAQRRRRVFVAASARRGFDPAEVLFERDGVRRDSAPSRGTGQDVAGRAPFGPALQCGCGHLFAESLGQFGCPNCEGDEGPAVSVLAGVPVFGHGNQGGSLFQNGTLTASGGRLDFDSESFVTGTLQANGKAAGSATQQDAEAGLLVPITVATLDARTQGGGFPGTDGACGGHVIPVPFDTTQVTSQANRSNPKPGDPCHPLAAGAHPPAIAFHPTQDPISSTDGTTHGLGCGSSGGQASVAVAYTTKLHNTQSNQAGKVYEEYATSIDANSPPPALLTAMQVRRLTPTECERLQGFPDGYTAIPWRNKPASECPDGPRYKALGNSWPTNVVRWLGRRIDRQIKQLEPA